jgi:hypothetical protein
MGPELFGLVLYEYLTAAIIAALGAYPVIHDGGAAVRAGRQRGNGSEIVGTTLVPALL